MTTKRKAKKRARERHNALRRLVATPDELLTELGRSMKHLNMSIEHALFYGDASLPELDPKKAVDRFH